MTLSNILLLVSSLELLLFQLWFMDGIFNSFWQQKKCPFLSAHWLNESFPSLRPSANILMMEMFPSPWPSARFFHNFMFVSSVPQTKFFHVMVTSPGFKGLICVKFIKVKFDLFFLRYTDKQEMFRRKKNNVSHLSTFLLQCPLVSGNNMLPWLRFPNKNLWWPACCTANIWETQAT